LKKSEREGVCEHEQRDGQRKKEREKQDPEIMT